MFLPALLSQIVSRSPKIILFFLPAMFHYITLTFAVFVIQSGYENWIHFSTFAQKMEL
jgi:hypothetical protein